MINRYDKVFHYLDALIDNYSLFLKTAREDHEMQKLKMFMKFTVLIAELNKRGNHVGSLTLFVCNVLRYAGSNGI